MFECWASIFNAFLIRISKNVHCTCIYNPYPIGAYVFMQIIQVLLNPLYLMPVLILQLIVGDCLLVVLAKCFVL